VGKNDVDPTDNNAIWVENVVGSYDPNDKQVLPATPLTPEMIADTQRLIYLIRFQNTGNYPASFVRIRDSLSTNLDLASIEVLGASHDYTWRLLPGRVVEFVFQNINLPDSISNEPESHGFVKFSIESLSDLVLNDSISNTAHIYFDFNAPIRTNTVVSVVDDVSPVSRAPLDVSNLRLYPVPTTDLLYIVLDRAPDIPLQVEVYDGTGRLKKTERSPTGVKTITLSTGKFKPGIYQLLVREKNKLMFGRFTKM
jgi:hypothetical protein